LINIADKKKLTLGVILEAINVTEEKDKSAAPLNYIDRLRNATETNGNIACLGIDPQLESIPDHEKNAGRTVVVYFDNLFAAFIRKKLSFPAFKINYGFFQKLNRAPWEYEGDKACFDVIKMIHDAYPDAIVIFDHKGGDIEHSSANYAAFDFSWDVDAAVVHFDMGDESVIPYAEYTKTGKGVYVLNKTTNSGARKIQNLPVLKNPQKFYGDLYFKLKDVMDIIDPNKPIGPDNPVPNAYDISEIVRRELEDGHLQELFEVVSEDVVGWARQYSRVGGVFGGNLEGRELERGARIYTQSGLSIPLLIPGVGKQGGNVPDVLDQLDAVRYEKGLALINSSRAIIAPWGPREKAPEDWSDVSAKALEKFIEEARYKRVV